MLCLMLNSFLQDIWGREEHKLKYFYAHILLYFFYDVHLTFYL